LHALWQNKFALESEKPGALKQIDFLGDPLTLRQISLEFWQMQLHFYSTTQQSLTRLFSWEI
jgi:hypothetical protein